MEEEAVWSLVSELLSSDGEPFHSKYEHFAEIKDETQSRVSLYRRPVEGSSLFEYFAEGLVPLSPEVLVCLNLDGEYKKQWNNTCKESRHVGSLDAETQVTFSVAKFPSPLSSREYLSARTVAQAPGRKSEGRKGKQGSSRFVLVGRAVNSPELQIPTGWGNVRVRTSYSITVVESARPPLPEGGVPSPSSPSTSASSSLSSAQQQPQQWSRLSLVYFENPEGSIPSYVVNFAARVTLPKMLGALVTAGNQYPPERLDKTMKTIRLRRLRASSRPSLSDSSLGVTRERDRDRAEEEQDNPLEEAVTAAGTAPKRVPWGLWGDSARGGSEEEEEEEGDAVETASSVGVSEPPSPSALVARSSPSLSPSLSFTRGGRSVDRWRLACLVGLESVEGGLVDRDVGFLFLLVLLCLCVVLLQSALVGVSLGIPLGGSLPSVVSWWQETGQQGEMMETGTEAQAVGQDGAVRVPGKGGISGLLVVFCGHAVLSLGAIVSVAAVFFSRGWRLRLVPRSRGIGRGVDSEGEEDASREGESENRRSTGFEERNREGEGMGCSVEGEWLIVGTSEEDEKVERSELGDMDSWVVVGL